MPRLPTRISITGLAIVLVLSAAGSAAAQADRGTITGTVTDSSGGVVANASVKAIHVATNFERTVTTSDQGTYTIPQLQVGAYVVVVTATGLRRFIARPRRRGRASGGCRRVWSPSRRSGGSGWTSASMTGGWCGCGRPWTSRGTG